MLAATSVYIQACWYFLYQSTFTFYYNNLLQHNCFYYYYCFIFFFYMHWIVTTFETTETEKRKIK